MRAFRNDRRADTDIELAITEDLAQRHRGLEIAAAGDVEHDRTLSLPEPVEERKRPLEVSHSMAPSAAIHSMQLAPQASSPACAA
ncbi:MAG: hypothetical protein WBE48_02380 [Xanthobacteraceae bacterium]